MRIIMLLSLLFNSFISTKAEVVNATAFSYIAYDVNENKIIEGMNYDEKRSVASISKIMTAIVTIESGMLDDFVVVSDVINKVDGSAVYLYVGEVITIEELVYGLMLRSGNDAAVTIASYISESIENFVIRMNKKAKELMMHNTTFYNPSGLDEDDGGNISTAKDMALLMAYAMKNETFRKITSTLSYKSTNHGVWVNKNKLLREYKYAVGGKTGYTRKARRTLVTAAKKDESLFVIVTLNCGSDFSFHKNMYEKILSTYKTYKLISRGNSVVDDYLIYCEKDVFGTYKYDVTIHFYVNEENGKVYVSTLEDKEIKGTCFIKKEIENKEKENKIKRFLRRLYFWEKFGV